MYNKGVQESIGDLNMDLINQEYRALGTIINLSVAPPASETLLSQAAKLINDFEDRLTVNREQSEVMSINHQAGIAPVAVSASTYQLIKRAVMVSRQNLGFNVAIGPLVKLWKIGFKGANKPSDKAIQERLALIDPMAIQLDDQNRSVMLTKLGMELDLGGIAKGFIADEIKNLWVENGVKTGMIDLGGNILLVGPSQHPDAKWNVGVQHPFKSRHVPLGILHIDAKSIGTSGIYERKLMVDGKEYHHMFDSQTGYPITNNLASVTIISDHSIDGEIWSTIGFYQGIQKGRALIEAQPGIEAVFVTRDLKVVVTSGLADQFSEVTG
jgi:thiamine biosynthesis lipoprotein